VSSALRHVKLRANPAYRAVAWNRLPSEPGHAVVPDADSYGVLMPRDESDLPVVAIDRDTALLFLSLQETGPAPDFMYSTGEEDGDRILRRLLYDSILELEQAVGFVSGLEACAALSSEGEAGRGSVAKLSIDALTYGAALRNVDAATLAQKLYTYNRRPMTTALRSRLPDTAACVAFLGLEHGHDAQCAVEPLWSRSDDKSPWLVFTRRQQRERQRAEQSCKLYVGLALEELPECLPSLVAELGRSQAVQFKIGADLDGLLRPDKLIAYFPSKDALLEAVHALQTIVAKRTVHAVPFTADIAAGGSLSWGIDPASEWFGGRLSWRQWICEKVASALIVARNGAINSIAPWQFAFERLQLEGVDTDTFMPTGRWSGRI
jgi:hypothetical protein